MRIRIALSLGALLLAGGAMAGTAVATAAPASAPAPTATTAPTVLQPAPSQTATTVPAPVRLTPAGTTSDVKPATPRAKRVPTAVPAGPTGDLHLPAIVEGR